VSPGASSSSCLRTRTKSLPAHLVINKLREDVAIHYNYASSREFLNHPALSDNIDGWCCVSSPGGLTILSHPARTIVILCLPTRYSLSPTLDTMPSRQRAWAKPTAALCQTPTFDSLRKAIVSSTSLLTIPPTLNTTTSIPKAHQTTQTNTKMALEVPSKHILP